MNRKVFKPFMGADINGKPAVIEPQFFDPDCDLYEQIQAMPPGKPVSLEKGRMLAEEEFLYYHFENYVPAKVREMCSAHWTVALSKMGYQIILNGTEYLEAA